MRILILIVGFFLIASLVLLREGKAPSEPVTDSFVPEEFHNDLGEFFDEEDEEDRQFIYSFFNDIFFVDPGTGEKSQLETAYEVSDKDMSLEEFAEKYEEIVGGNILGVEKLDEGEYRTDMVMFSTDRAWQYQFEVEVKDNKVRNLDQISKKRLDFGKAEVLDSIDSPSGDYQVYTEKSLIPVTFYTVEGIDVPGYLGRYDLMLKSDDGEERIDYSFDRFSSNQPFEVMGFNPTERFVEYFEWDFVRFFNVYDIQEGIKTNIELAGRLEDYIWLDNKFLSCTTGSSGELPAIAVAGPGNWQLNEQFFIYPPVDRLQLSNAAEVFEWLEEYYADNKVDTFEELACQFEADSMTFKDLKTGQRTEMSFDMNFF